MTSRLGLELGTRSIRAVRLSGWRDSNVRTMETSWDPENPVQAIAAVREHLGTARHVTAAVDLGLIHVKRLKLPPLPLAEKREILGLEPDRYFGVRGEELVFAFNRNDDLVFAAPEPVTAAWIDVLEGLGQLNRVEPSPIALTRALARAGVKDALVLQVRQPGGIALIELRGGQLHNVRRFFGEPEDAAAVVAEQRREEGTAGSVFVHPFDEDLVQRIRDRLPEHDVESLPRPAGLDPTYLTAYGTALEIEHGWPQAFLTPELERSLSRRSRLRQMAAGAACVVALIFGVLSVDAYRARTERELDARIAALQEAAAGALELQERAATLGRQAQAMSDFESGQVDLLRALLELSRRLPEDAWIRTIRATAPGDWELDGYARDAAALIPLFENDPRFEDVRFRSATSRTQVGTETYENFSLALRTLRAP